jgi:hypothetical protein
MTKIKLNWMSKEELRQLRRADRAEAFLDSLAGHRFLNDLDALGWMLVPRILRPLLPELHKDGWPVPIGTRAKWPSWCNHEYSAAEMAKRAKPQRPKLRLVEKHPDDTA